MKKKYPNLMMQSASSYDTTKVKESVEQQVKEEQYIETAANIIEESPVEPQAADTTITNMTNTTVIQQTISPKKAAKPRLRQQAYYLTELEIKTIKRLSYELDIPKSDLVRKFIDDGIAQLDKTTNNE